MLARLEGRLLFQFMRPSLLVVTAHPDDESFGFGGVLARYGWQRVRTVLVTATDGSAGQTGGLVEPDEIVERRQQELKRAVSILGVETHLQWTYSDGALADVPRETILLQLVQVMRAVRPQVVLTFGPEGGGNEHTDHIAISHFATDAWERAGDADYKVPGLQPFQPATLFYITVSPDTEMENDIAYATPTAKIDISAALAVKRAAFFAHRTQQSDRTYYTDYQTKQGPYEWYHEVSSSQTLGTNSIDTDLFAGLDVEIPESPVSFLIGEKE